MTEQEFRRVFQDHNGAVYGFALRMTGSVQAAEDVAQDCFVELLRRPGTFNPACGTMRQFLIGVARNLVYRHWRTARRMEAIEQDLRKETPDPMAMLIGAAVQSLPPLQREALVLFEYEGFTLDEIGKLVDADVGTVKSRLHRGREKLRHMLAPLKNGSGGNQK